MTTTLTAPELTASEMHGLETIRERHVSDRRVTDESEQDEPRLTPVLVHLSGDVPPPAVPLAMLDLQPLVVPGAEAF